MLLTDYIVNMQGYVRGKYPNWSCLDWTSPTTATGA